MSTVWLKTTNNAVTTLEEALAAGALTVNLTSTAHMPGTYPFRLTIWDAALYGYRNPDADPSMEIIEVTGPDPYPYAYAPDEYVITRGMEGTSDVAHALGQTVALLITAGMIQQIQNAITALEP